MNKKNLTVLASVIVFLLSTGSTVSPAWSQGASGDVEQLSKRVAELENQIVNMQVIIGTLESLVKEQKSSGIGQFSTQSSANGQETATDSGASERIDILETQIRALTAQMEQLTLQSRQNGNSAPVEDKRSDLPAAEQSEDAEKTAEGPQGQTGSGTSDDVYRQKLAALPNAQVAGEAGGSGDPSLLYDEAYGHMLRRDYGAAEVAFQDFLRLHGKDKLAGNAQYWLGETYFKRNDFRNAADHFLKGYSKYRDGQKAPDSLLKLALSLQKLGQKDAACTTFEELKKIYPEAADHIRKRADDESRKLKC